MGKKTKKAKAAKDSQNIAKVVGTEDDFKDPELPEVKQPIPEGKPEISKDLNELNINETPMQGNLTERIKENKAIVIAVALGIIIGGIVLWKILSGKDNKLSDTASQNTQEEGMSKQSSLNSGNVSPFTGLPCENYNRRAIAVMEAGDVSTRPLSGLSEADLVVEMPAITASITRLMGIYLCNSPKDIGSVRSTRHDYITLAKGFDAMLAHWGGSHFALEMLQNKNTVPNLDAMSNPNGAFYRKDGIPAPDNGFATYQGLWAAAEKLGYRLTNNFEGYPHQDEALEAERAKGGNLRIGFAGPYGVNYTYDPKTNSYLRTWGDKEDIDKNNGQRLAPKNVVVMFAASRQIEGQYNDVDVEGEGELHVFMNGQEVVGKWVKEKNSCVIGNELVCMTDSKLKFLDENGTEIKLVPGQIWLEVLEPGQTLKWTPIR
ncbi:MAG: DUF3048 domain-containing protein [Candidatus Moranbacteria bacterium]|nr:DUF3048 domain-containing protein [Candidatus Moranbacteria bacterium]